MSAVEVPAAVLDLEERRQAARKAEERARAVASEAAAHMDEVDDELRDARNAAGLCEEDHHDGNHPRAHDSQRFCARCLRARRSPGWL